ncbi:MAG: hypothetical protein U0167_15320 [bacterium]
MRRLAAIATAAALSAVLACPAAATVIRVPEDYPSVLAGVDAAVAGDSVLVGPGTWADREVRTVPHVGEIQSAMFLKPGVTVIGVAGVVQTVLDGGPSGSNSLGTIVHALGGTETARVIGFTITGGGEGVVASRASPLELVACRIDHNYWSGVDAYWVTVALTDCVISNNQGGPSANHEPGVRCEDAVMACTRCTFERNAGQAVRILWYEGFNQLNLSDCMLRDQSAGGVFASSALVDIERCWFLRVSLPSSGAGAGVYTDNCSGVVKFCAFVFDSAYGAPGAYILDNSVMRLENNLFYGCVGRSWASALAINGNDAGTRNNIFAYNTGRVGAAEKSGGPSSPESGCNLFYHNVGGDYAGQWVHAPTDLDAPPLFCNAPALDFTVQKRSPAANGNWVGCGLIGPFGVGCNPVSVEPQTWGRLKAAFR